MYLCIVTLILEEMIDVECNCVNTLEKFIAPLLVSARISSDSRVVKVRPGKVKNSKGEDTSLFYYDKEPSINGRRTISNSLMNLMARVDDVMKVVKFMRDKLEYENTKKTSSGNPVLVAYMNVNEFIMYSTLSDFKFEDLDKTMDGHVLKWNEKRNLFNKAKRLIEKAVDLGFIVKEEEDFYGLNPELSPYNSLTRVVGYYEELAFSMAQHSAIIGAAACRWLYKYPYLREWEHPIILAEPALQYGEDGEFYPKAFVFKWLCNHTDLNYACSFPIDLDAMHAEAKKEYDRVTKKSLAEVVSKMLHYKYIYMEKSGKNVKWTDPVFRFTPPEMGVCVTNYKFVLDDYKSMYVKSTNQL